MKNLFLPSVSLAFVLLSATASLSIAQTATPSAPASAAGSSADDKNIPEWVKKQADNPIKWIIQHDSKAKPKAAAVAEDKTAKRVTANTTTATTASTKKPSRPDEDSSVANPSASNATSSLSNTRTAPSSATPTAAAATAKPAEAPPVQTPAATKPDPKPEATNVATLTPQPEPPAPPKSLIEELVPISQPQPTLTRDVFQAGIKQGRVVVNFMVNPDGSVTDVAIGETSDRLLNRSVLAAVKQWIYKPIAKAQANSAVIAFQLE